MTSRSRNNEWTRSRSRTEFVGHGLHAGVFGRRDGGGTMAIAGSGYEDQSELVECPFCERAVPLGDASRHLFFKHKMCMPEVWLTRDAHAPELVFRIAPDIADFSHLPADNLLVAGPTQRRTLGSVQALAVWKLIKDQQLSASNMEFVIGSIGINRCRSLVCALDDMGCHNIDDAALEVGGERLVFVIRQLRMRYNIKSWIIANSPKKEFKKKSNSKNSSRQQNRESAKKGKKGKSRQQVRVVTAKSRARSGKINRRRAQGKRQSGHGSRPVKRPPRRR